MSLPRAELARQVVAASHALHERGWVANHDGNVSVRWTKDRFVVTPTAISKADATEGGLAVTGPDGKPVEGEARPPSEFALHLGAYRIRPDIGAVVHAHPPYATAMACAGVALETFLPEAIVSMGVRVPLSRFALPFGKEGSAVVEELVDRYDAILLCRHGVLTVGKDVEQALLRMELVEHMARIHTLALPHGGVKALPPEVIEPLLAKRRKAGLGLAAERSGSAAPEAGTAPAEMTVEAPTPSPNAWKPAGPPPAPDAWSGGKTEGACGPVYGAGGGSATADPAQPSASGDLASAVRSEISRILGK